MHLLGSGAGSAAGISDGAVLALVGIGVVFTALLLIWGAVSLVGTALRTQRLGRSAAEGQPARDAAAPASGGLDVDKHLLVVLSAAAAAALGRRVRVTRVRRLRRDANSNWTGHGRIAVHASHRLKRV